MSVFYMTVGLPGSGKSTYVLSEIDNAFIHSSDSIRFEFFGDESCQENNEFVFKTLHRRIKDDLIAGKNVVYDATNLKWTKRKTFLNELRQLKLPDLHTVCLFFAVPLEDCLSNQSARERQVPSVIIENMHKNIDIPMYCEGWDNIEIICPRQKVYRELLETMYSMPHDNPHHTSSVGQHCYDACEKLDPSAPLLVQIAAILHDIGKVYTKSFVNGKGEATDVAHYYRHENVGAYESFFYTESLDDNERLYVAKLIRWHMYPYAIKHSPNPERTKKKFKNVCNFSERRDIYALHGADCAAH